MRKVIKLDARDCTIAFNEIEHLSFATSSYSQIYRLVME